MGLEAESMMWKSINRTLLTVTHRRAEDEQSLEDEEVQKHLDYLPRIQNSLSKQAVDSFIVGMRASRFESSSLLRVLALKTSLGDLSQRRLMLIICPDTGHRLLYYFSQSQGDACFSKRLSCHGTCRQAA